MQVRGGVHADFDTESHAVKPWIRELDAQSIIRVDMPAFRIETFSEIFGYIWIILS